MRTGIEQARIELEKWDARVAEDQAALAVAKRDVANIRERLAASTRTAAQLRYAVQQWDRLQADRTARGLKPLA